MLIDDDETILETLQFNLKRHGFETFAFKNGKHALSEFDEKNPSLVIIDWMLPDLVGPEICKLIRSRASDVPILMLTGRARPDDVAEGGDINGIRSFLVNRNGRIAVLGNVGSP